MSGWREPTAAELERFPELPPGATAPAENHVLELEGGELLRAAVWGDGSYGDAYGVGVQVIPAPGSSSARLPTLEECYNAVTAGTLKGVLFQLPGIVSGFPMIDPEPHPQGDPPEPPLFLLVQLTAIPDTPAARRLQLTAPPGAPTDGNPHVNREAPRGFPERFGRR